MTITENNRLKFQLIGRDRIAVALATGTIQTLGINERDKGEALEWVQEQEAERASARQLETTRFETIRRWTIIAAVASAIAATAAVISIFR
jgi:hypothetical protein